VPSSLQEFCDSLLTIVANRRFYNYKHFTSSIRRKKKLRVAPFDFWSPSGFAFAFDITCHIASILKYRNLTSKWSTNRPDPTELRFLLGIIPYRHGVLHLILEQTSRETTTKECVTTHVTVYILYIHQCVSPTRAKMNLAFAWTVSLTKFPKAFCLRGMLSNPVKDRAFICRLPGAKSLAPLASNTYKKFIKPLLPQAPRSFSSRHLASRAFVTLHDSWLTWDFLCDGTRWANGPIQYLLFLVHELSNHLNPFDLMAASYASWDHISTWSMPLEVAPG